MTASVGNARRAHSSEIVRALFHVTAAADPGVLPRLIEPLAKTGHVPTRLHASAEAGDGSELSVDLRVAALDRTVAERMAGQLRAVVGVRAVIAVFEAAT
jgi:hypothetical protein